ncbi:MAG: hypothetical protein U0587_05470 [Candidatus Binatia bacterium]
MRDRVRFGGILLAALVVALRLQTAGATTFVLMDEESLLRSSEVVLVGTVTAIEAGVGRKACPYVRSRATAAR